MKNEEQTNIEKYEFEPIKGYPMLQWKGKRPFRSTQYFPAQLKEVYGKEDESGWINKIFWGDNLQVMSHLLKSFRGQISLIYIDPPFDSKADYKKSIKLRGQKLSNEYSGFEEKQYTDLWSNDDYLQFMYERLILIRELLSEDGSVWVHCDWRKSHHIRLILDEVFGPGNFRGHITCRTMTSSGYKGKTSLGKSSADLLYYSKSQDSFIYNPVYTPMTENMRSRYVHDDGDGRLYKDSYLGDVTERTIEELRAENKLYVTKNGGYRIKHYLDEAKGTLVDNIWNDIDVENSQSSILTGYPTQKPEALLDRIVKMCSNEGDIVFDCFMGSGTTQAVASKLNRRFIGADINLGSVQTTAKRLVGIDSNFSVYNVNNYNIFRNPVEAKDLLIEALEIHKFDNSSVYDGEKDGYKVKIMPVNRIATKEDLNELLSNFPYRKFEERKAEFPNKPVEAIMLVCMGHEPGLAAALENECGYKLRVEVVDILRNKSDLTFKYDSEAVLEVRDGKLIVEAFYPRNLLQKLSQQKEDVTEWREMVESIMIDWNYDGAVMEPVVIDIPEKDQFVQGVYDIPQGASNIKVKITDLLSESYEEVISHG